MSWRNAVSTTIFFTGFLLVVLVFSMMLYMSVCHYSSYNVATPLELSFLSGYDVNIVLRVNQTEEDYQLYYLHGNDTVRVDYRFSSGVEWEVNVTVVHISSNRSWSYHDIGCSSSPPSLLFIAPEKGVYLFAVKVRVLNASSQISAVKLHYEPRTNIIHIRDCLPELLNVVIVGVALMVIGFVFKFIPWDKDYPRLLHVVSWEFNSFWKPVFLTIFSLLTMFSYSPLPTVYHTMIVEPGTPLNEVVGPRYANSYANVVYDVVSNYHGHVFEYILFYCIILALMIYTYEYEKKLFRDTLVAGVEKIEVYMVKLCTLLLYTVTPLIVAHTILFYVADPGLWSRFPTAMAWFLLRRIVTDIAWVLMIYAIVFLPFIVLRKTIYALVIGLVTPYVLHTILSPQLKHYLPQVLMEEYLVKQYVGGLLPSNAIPLIVLFLIEVIVGYVAIYLRDHG